MVIAARTLETLREVLAQYGFDEPAIADIRTGRVNKHWRVVAGERVWPAAGGAEHGEPVDAQAASRLSDVRRPVEDSSALLVVRPPVPGPVQR